MKLTRSISIIFFLLVFNLSLFAADDAEKKDEKGDTEDQIVETGHKVRIDGKSVSYTVNAGTIVMKEEDGTPKAKIFFVAYTKNGEEKAKRPVTFAYNGGPGSSSVWLHLGVLGPKRVLMDDDGNPLPPPYKLVENEYSILDLTDIVFIDPVTTGFSRAVKGESDKQFHGLREDIESVGEFIRLYTTRYSRWSSPKFLAGESYGTTRSAGLSGYLQDRHGMYLNGVVLISSILNFQTARFDVGNDLPHILFLPTYTATAWYHKQLADRYQVQPVENVLKEAEEFASGDYTLALMKGDSLSEAETAAIAKRLSELTGLSEEYVRQTNLRINIFRFTKELMRSQRKTVGRLDSRFTGIDRDAAGDGYEFDPSYAAIQGPYTATLNDYVRTELEFESDLPYEILTGRVHPWNYSSSTNQYVNVGETLREAMHYNPHLKVFVANGYYDLATPYFATDYTFNHLQLDPSLKSNITMTYYASGHMMYIHIPSLIQLKEDLKAFYQSAVQKAE